MSQRGDSGKNQTMLMRTSRGMIWNAMGKRQRMGDQPPSTNERPLGVLDGGRGWVLG
jgi:hypothetical protein